MGFKQILGIVILLIVFIGLLKVIGPGGASLPNLVDSLKLANFSSFELPDSTGGGPTGASAPVSDSYVYQLVDTSSKPGMDPYGQIFYNAKLVRVYGDRTETVVENFRNRFSNIITQPNQTLTQYYFPPNSDVLYFAFKVAYTQGTGNRYHLYRYDVKADTMKDLFSNRYLTSYVIPSPNNPLLMLAVDDDTIRTYQRLYLVNLANDNARLLVSLGGNETFASAPLGTGGSSADVYWVGENVVEYGVYKKINDTTTQFYERRQIPF